MHAEKVHQVRVIYNHVEIENDNLEGKIIEIELTNEEMVFSSIFLIH